jgi:hypothetical protein
MESLFGRLSVTQTVIVPPLPNLAPLLLSHSR